MFRRCMTAYATYIRPTVEYASPVWDQHTKRNTNKVEMVQRRCSRYDTGNFDHTSSVASLLNCLSWPTLEERRRQYRLAVMYRILHNQVDIHWQSFLTKTSSCPRVHSCRLFVPFCKNHVYASSFFLALVKTGITLPWIQLMHHPLTPLSGNWGMTTPRYLSIVISLLTPPPLVMFSYLQNLDAALFLEEEEYFWSISDLSAL